MAAMVDVEGLDSAEIPTIKELIRNHIAYTDSSLGTKHTDELGTNMNLNSSASSPVTTVASLDAIEAAKATGISGRRSSDGRI